MPGYYARRVSFDFRSSAPPGVRGLILATGACFLVQNIAGAGFNRIFGLVVGEAVRRLMLWQFASYLFLHAGAVHILFNMFALWMFGRDVEGVLGTRRFVFFYFFCGIGAGICSYLFYPPDMPPIIGASGAIFGVLVAFGMLFPDRTVTLFVFFVLPVQMKAKAMVWIFAGIELLFVASDPYGGVVARFTHLGGAICGYLYMRWLRRGGPGTGFGFRRPASFSARVMDDDPGSVDEILDKISRHGMGSLTGEERERLRRASRR